jgi:quinol-cytochrome oxidoreductase complex cytochrome b subunit
MRMLRNNGLTIALLTAFLISMIGMTIAGYYHENEQLAQHGLPAISIAQYLTNENFLSALFENWESEWLQMATYVVLTAYLFQKGSAESRDPEGPSEGRHEKDKPRYPARLNHSPLLRWLYGYSLGLALLLLFILSFLGHILASHLSSNAEAAIHGNSTQSLLAYVGGARFWFESFQNWQSEFFSTAMLVFLSIFLRYKGSPESKPLSASHNDTGG